MSLGGYAGGGGKTFLPAGEIEDGTEARLLEQPVMAEKDFGKGPETAPTFVMSVKGLDEDSYEWTPGKFAVGFLLQHLGVNEAEWSYPVEGHFERRTVQTKFGKKKALHFIPDGITEEAGSPKTSTKATGKGSATTAATGGKTTPKTEFKCKRHPVIAFANKDEYLAHLESH